MNAHQRRKQKRSNKARIRKGLIAISAIAQEAEQEMEALGMVRVSHGYDKPAVWEHPDAKQDS